MTAFAAIVTAILNRLGGDAPVCENLFRARRSVVPEACQQAVNVQFEGALPAPAAIAGAPVDWQSKVTVDCYSVAVRESGDAAVDPLFQAVYERLASDPTLAGLVGDIGVPTIEAENSEEGRKTGWIRLTYFVQHRTSNDTLN